MPNSIGENDDAYEVIGEPNTQILENHQSESDEIVVTIFGYQKVTLRVILFHLFCVMCIGIPYLLLGPYPKYNHFKYKKCSLRTAKYICVIDTEGSYAILYVQDMDLNLSNHKDGKVRYFIYQHTRYIWIKDQGAFVNVQSLNEKLSLGFLMESMTGVNKRQQNELLKLYGPNSVEVEVKSYWTLFKCEVFNPFYLFQIFSIVLWSFDEYYQYAACVFLLSAGSCIMSLYTTKKMSLMLHKMAGSMSAMAVSVVRPGRAQCVVAGCRLVPGDVLVLPPAGYTMPCDALLLTGSCIVNESMLTGESVPVMKSPPNPSFELYSTDNHKRHTLFAGTQVIQTRFYDNNQVLAKVVRTGFYTAKGELIKSILFPKPFGFQFYKDSVKFILFLFSIAAVGMAYCIWLYVERGSTWDTIVLRTLDIITIVVPPALPAAMTAGTVNSQRRLRAHKIYCLSPPRINVCGKLQLICFDKTGTLTEDGLELHAVLPAREGGMFGHCVRDARALASAGPLLQALASCHSLTSVDGSLTGDPLDLHMFHFTSWVLEEPGPENSRFDTLSPPVVKPATTNEAALQDLDEIDPLTMEIPYEIGLLRRFHFSSTQQSMGVIARVLGQQQMVYFVKGAPEKIAGMCQPDSLPENFSAVLNDYTSNGFRVIGLAYKQLRMKWVDAQRVKRDQLECDMLFLGLLVMQNSLKPETADVIKDLHDAKIRQIMVTGDNIMTAMSVGRVCGMVPSHQKLLLVTVGTQTSTEEPPPLCFEVIGEGEVPKFELRNVDDSYALAVEGRTWIALKHHYPELMKHVLARGTIFGRFGPDQKTQLVVALQEGDVTVGMCGDGANDCGALKAAHIGVSLSQADASVAAPFTSHEQNIRCVKLLALEGRCALSTSFAIFKYMALYSLIQFFSILILYHFYSILGNNQFLYIDLVLTTLLAISLGRAGPAPSLSPHAPPHSLVVLSSTVPLTMQVLLVLLAQLLALKLLCAQPWFSSVEGGPNIEVIRCWENTVIFIISCYQYLILACVYSKGRPFRQRFCSNYYMVVTLITQCIIVSAALLCPWRLPSKLFELVPSTEQVEFRLFLLVVPALHLMLAVAVEATAAEGSSFRRLFFGGKNLTSRRISCGVGRDHQVCLPEEGPDVMLE